MEIQEMIVRCDCCQKEAKKSFPKDWKKVELVVSSYDYDEGWTRGVVEKKDLCEDCDFDISVSKRKGIEKLG